MNLKNKCLWMLAGLLISSQSLIMAQNTPVDIPPANEYRQLSCNQLGRLMYAVNELAWQGKTVEEIYIALTPADTSMRVRFLHGGVIPNYVMKQPQGVESELALQTLAAGVIQECSKEGVLEELTDLLEGGCDQFVGWVPRVVAMREQGRPAQEFVDRLSNAWDPKRERIFWLTTNANATEFVNIIYNHPDKTEEQLAGMVRERCQIQFQREDADNK